MLYPRKTTEGGLILETQMVGVREHLTQSRRCLFMTGTITGETESHNLLMALDTLSHEPIKLVITSPGGDLDSAFLFYDTMKLIKSPIITLGRYCASAASFLLAAGKERYLFPHAKVMIHQVWGQAAGFVQEMEIQHAELEKYQDRMVDIFQECGVKKSRKEILKDIERTKWLEPDEAIAYGLADKIIDQKTLSRIL